MKELLPQVPWQSSFRRLAAITAFVLAPAVAEAAFTCTGPTPPSFTFSSSPAGRGIPRDTPAFTRISDWGPWQQYGNTSAAWHCTFAANDYTGLYSRATASFLPIRYMESGNNHMVFPTNVPGVGVIAQWVWLSQSTEVMAFSGPTYWGPPFYWYNTGNNWPANWGFQARFAYVKTGPITFGTVAPITLGQFSPYQEGSGTTLPGPYTVNFQFGGGATFSSLACTTPSITVQLGTHRDLDLNTSGAAPWTHFNIEVKNCPDGINTVQYRLDPTTDLVDATNGIVALDSSSSAHGISLQVLDGTGAPFQLSKDVYLSGYSTSGGNYTIPMQARYVKTGPVSGGSANSSMTFTMTYL